MSLSEPNKLDIVAKSKEGEIVLGISANHDWKNDPKMVQELDIKLRTYIAYIESDTYTKEYGKSPVFIQIMTAYELSPEAVQLVDKVKGASGIEIKTVVTGVFNPWKK
jgi:hypothetical protein